MNEMSGANPSPQEILKEKRKWQIAMRRYILEKQPSAQYAPYFGITVEGFRGWIAMQFIGDLSWENFGKQWQLEHIVPVQYFNLQEEEDQKLCWNFLNIRVKNEAGPSQLHCTGFASTHYFKEVYELTQLEIAGKMVQKLLQLQAGEMPATVREYIQSHTETFQQWANLDGNSLWRINQGETLENILLEQSIVQKFGS